MICAGFNSPITMFRISGIDREQMSVFFRDLIKFLYLNAISEHKLISDRLYRKYVRKEDARSTYHLIKSLEDKFIEEKISDDEYLFSARLEVDYINETYHLNLPESEEYETLSGLILLHTEEIPTQGETISLPPFVFSIEACSQTRIETVRIFIKESDE